MEQDRTGLNRIKADSGWIVLTFHPVLDWQMALYTPSGGTINNTTTLSPLTP